MLERTFAARAIGYGLPGLRVDGNDALAVYAATRWAAERARSNHGPTLIEMFTYRGEAHSTSDDPTRYRPADERSAWPLGDPIERLKQHMIELGQWDEARHDALVKDVETEVRAAQKEAEKSGTLGDDFQHSIESMFDDVFEDTPWHLKEQSAQAIEELAEKRRRDG